MNLHTPLKNNKNHVVTRWWQSNIDVTSATCHMLHSFLIPEPPSKPGRPEEPLGRSGAMLLSNAAMSSEITIAKIKLAFGRNYHNTLHPTLWQKVSMAQAALRTELCSQEGSTARATQRKSLPKFKVQTSLCLPVFIVLKQGREETLRGWAKKRRVLLCHLPEGFSPSILTPLGSRPTPMS